MIRLSLYLSGRLVSKDGFDRTEVVLGRDQGCDITIDNLGVSRRHARVYRQDEKWHVEDLGSQNGIHVCGSRVKRHVLLAEDEFTLGKYTVRFEEIFSSSSRVAVPVAASAAHVAATMPEPALSLDTAVGQEDKTFVLDRSDLAKIIDKARTPVQKASRAPRLTRIKPANPSMVVPLSRNHYMAGTAKDCDIRLKGWFTPRKAALFVQEGGRDLVISLSDSTRVKVNKKKVDSRTLVSGDRVKIGRNIFIYTRG
jgi:predicted component of type VI protein secretion system